MSVYVDRVLPCGRCGKERVVRDVDSANPSRHPPFAEQLAARSLNRFRCVECEHVDVSEGPMLWTDVTAGLVAYLLPPARRPSWQQLEAEVAAGLTGPVRYEGPDFVRAWGAGARIRLVFGLEELRQQVVLAGRGLDDAVVEVLKEPWVDHAEATGPVVDRVDPDGLHLVWPPPVDHIAAVPEAVAVLGWDAYRAAVERRDDLLARRPGLASGTWVHWVRARFPPLAAAER